MDLAPTADQRQIRDMVAEFVDEEVSREVANDAIQIHGGYGYVSDFPVERYYRDAKLNEIYEAASEVLRNTIGERVQ